MYNYREEDIGKVEIIDRVDIFDYKRTFVYALAEKEGQPIKLNNEFDAERIKGLMNIPENTIFKSLRDPSTGKPYWGYQRVDYVKSNLGRGKGFVFYFLCGRCGLQVKYLYFFSYLESPVCRRCCQLPYKQKSYRERKLNLSR